MHPPWLFHVKRVGPRRRDAAPATAGVGRVAGRFGAARPGSDVTSGHITREQACRPTGPPPGRHQDGGHTWWSGRGTTTPVMRCRSPDHPQPATHRGPSGISSAGEGLPSIRRRADRGGPRARSPTATKTGPRAYRAAPANLAHPITPRCRRDRAHPVTKGVGAPDRVTSSALASAFGLVGPRRAQGPLRDRRPWPLPTTRPRRGRQLSTGR